MIDSGIDKRVLKVRFNKLHHGARVIRVVSGNVYKAIATNEQTDSSHSTALVQQIFPTDVVPEINPDSVPT